MLGTLLNRRSFLSGKRFPAQRQVCCPKSFKENECLRLANDGFFCCSRRQIHEVLEVKFSAYISALNSMFGTARNFFLWQLLRHLCRPRKGCVKLLKVRSWLTGWPSRKNISVYLRLKKILSPPAKEICMASSILIMSNSESILKY